MVVVPVAGNLLLQKPKAQFESNFEWMIVNAYIFRVTVEIEMRTMSQMRAIVIDHSPKEVQADTSSTFNRMYFKFICLTRSLFFTEYWRFRYF